MKLAKETLLLEMYRVASQENLKFKIKVKSEKKEMKAGQPSQLETLLLQEQQSNAFRPFGRNRKAQTAKQEIHSWLGRQSKSHGLVKI